MGGLPILSGVSVAVGDVVSCGSGNQISLNLQVLIGHPIPQLPDHLWPPVAQVGLLCTT